MKGITLTWTDFKNKVASKNLSIQEDFVSPSKIKLFAVENKSIIYETLLTSVSDINDYNNNYSAKANQKIVSEPGFKGRAEEGKNYIVHGTHLQNVREEREQFVHFEYPSAASGTVYIERIKFSSQSLDCFFEIHKNVGINSGGTARTPQNMNFGEANSSDVNFYDNSSSDLDFDITPIYDNLIDSIHISSSSNIINYNGSLILKPGNSFAIVSNAADKKNVRHTLSIEWSEY